MGNQLFGTARTVDFWNFGNGHKKHKRSRIWYNTTCFRKNKGTYISYAQDINPLAEVAIGKYGAAYNEIVRWWKNEIGLEAWYFSNCSYWKNSRLFFDILQKHRAMAKDSDPDALYEQRIYEKTKKNEQETMEKSS